MLAACGSLPQPFVPTEKKLGGITGLKEGLGVSLAPIDGLPRNLSDGINQALKQNLLGHEIPATLENAAKANGGFRMTSVGKLTPIDAIEDRLTIDWTVFSIDNLPIETIPFETKLPHSEDGILASEDLLKLAATAIPHFLPLFSDDVASHEPLPNAVALGAIIGAPSDGALALKRSIEYILGKHGVPVAAPGAPYAMQLNITVTLGSVANDAQTIRIRWNMVRANGKPVGGMTQENTIKAGSLDHGWGDTAFDVATAAYDGIEALIAEANGAPATE